MTPRPAPLPVSRATIDFLLGLPPHELAWIALNIGRIRREVSGAYRGPTNPGGGPPAKETKR